MCDEPFQRFPKTNIVIRSPPPFLELGAVAEGGSYASGLRVVFLLLCVFASCFVLLFEFPMLCAPDVVLEGAIGGAGKLTVGIQYLLKSRNFP